VRGPDRLTLTWRSACLPVASALSLPQQARQQARTAASGGIVSAALYGRITRHRKTNLPCLHHSWNETEIDRAACFSDLVMRGVLAYWHRRSLAQHSIYMAHTRVVVFYFLATMAHQGS